ncbi:MAG: hypothetical protein IJS02_02190 [Bacteroidales bacterium]|nr:hypothetical protein [Bacteroidales bacterium]
MKSVKIQVLQLAGALLVTISNPAYSQTIVTKETLAQLAAQNAETYNAIVTELMATGEEGLTELLSIVKNKEEGQVGAEYAITAMIAKVTDPASDPKLREAFKDILHKEASSAPEGQYKEFMVRELMVMGENFGQKNASFPGDSDFDVPMVPPTLKDLAAVLKDKTVTRQGRFFMLDNTPKTKEASAVVLKALRGMKDDEAIVDLLYWLGESGIGDNAETVKHYVSTRRSLPVCTEAAMALVKLGRPSDVKTLANLFTSSNPDYVDLALTCLKSFPGKVTDSAVKFFGKANDYSKSKILELIAQRKDSNYLGLVKQCIDSKNPVLQDAAFKALENVVKKSDTQYLYGLLEICPQDKLPLVQKAVVASFDSFDNEQIHSALLARKDFVGKDKEALYWPMIISTATIDEVFGICETAQDDALQQQAFTAYVNAVRATKDPGAQKLLMFREIMPLAKTAAQKKNVLDNIARTDCFLAIPFAGNYLDDPDVKQNAAQVIRRIGTAHIEYNSPVVVDLLKKAAVVITGTDPGYEVTSINKHLEDLPKDTLGYVLLEEFVKTKALDRNAGSYDIYADLKFDGTGAKWNSFHAVKQDGKVTLLLNGTQVTDAQKADGYIDLIFDALEAKRKDVSVRDVYVRYEG